MGNIIIILTTIFLVTILIFRSINNNRIIRKTFTKTIKDINCTYKEMFKSKSILNKLLNGGIVILSDIFGLAFAFAIVSRYVNLLLSPILVIAIKVLITIIIFLVIHYAIGYVLLVTSRIQRFIHKVEDKNLKVDFLLSYFIIITFLAILLIFPEHFSKSAVFGLISLTICYILNLRVLLKLMISPSVIKSVNEDSTSISRVVSAAILILIMLVLNLFLAVCFVNSLGNNVYLNASGNFDLFYYTLITFTTIGYGDIIPTTILAKALAIIISLTSVMCLTIFLSKILSADVSENEKSEAN